MFKEDEMKNLFSESAPSFSFKLVDVNMISFTNPSQQIYGNSTISRSEHSLRVCSYVNNDLRKREMIDLG